MLAPVQPSAADGVLGRIGPLEVRLARDAAEIAVAQEVRYRVFFEELGARGGLATETERRDADRFDEFCDHLLVFDTALPGPSHQQIVGTYRLLRQEKADATGGFYSSDEFELDRLVKRHPDLHFLELGRSCVLPPYRTKRVIEVLWQGIWNYCQIHKIDVMTGCASFHGTDPSAHAAALSLLAHNYCADGDWSVRAVPSRYHSMNLMPADQVDLKRALNELPPLVKGYLRLGAKFGEGCVIDEPFDTIDVLVVLPVEWISGRYLNYYGSDPTRFAA
ncbi:MAG: GNAT family N-acetyltransferase [Rhizobiaceae bacterium]